MIERRAVIHFCYTKVATPFEIWMECRKGGVGEGGGGRESSETTQTPISQEKLRYKKEH